MENEVVSNLPQLISFRLDNHYFGIDIINVKAIIDVTSITPVSGTPLYTEKIINLHGDLLHIVNLREKLRLPEKEYIDDFKLIVIDIYGVSYGFCVDEIGEILRIPVSAIQENTKFIDGLDTKFIIATGIFMNHILSLLDINKILSDEGLII